MFGSAAQIVDLRIRRHKTATRSSSNGLVRHDGRLFAFDDLLRHAPEAAFSAAMETCPDDYQVWWDELLSKHPEEAKATVALCRSFGTVEPCRILPFIRTLRTSDEPSDEGAV